MKTDIFDLQTILLTVIIVLLLIQYAIELIRYFKKRNQKNTEKADPSINEITNNIENNETVLETQLEDFQQRLQAIENKLSENGQKTKSNQTQTTNNDKHLIDKVKNVDFLKEYAENVCKYLETLDNIFKTAYKRYQELQQYEKTINAVGCLLQNACMTVLDLGKWMKLADEIKTYGIVINNQDIKNCFQSNNNYDRIKQFKILFSTPLKKYTNNLLILCEAMRNLSKFNNGEVAVGNIEKEFETQFNIIIKEAKNVGILEIDVAKLFTNITLNNNNIESINGNVSLPYLKVNDLKTEEIVEIVEFGMKTEFEKSKSRIKVLIK